MGSITMGSTSIIIQGTLRLITGTSRTCTTDITEDTTTGTTTGTMANIMLPTLKSTATSTRR